MPSARIHHVSLSVRDLGASAQWYGQVLGFEAAKWVERDEFARVILATGDRPVLGLTQHRAGRGDAFDERRAGLDHVAIALVRSEELTGWQQKLERLGVVHSPPTGGIIVLRDPDNIQLEICAIDR